MTTSLCHRHVLRLAKAAEAVAAAIETRVLPMRKLDRSVVFSSEGRPCCATGHVIARAGLKTELGRFKGSSFDGAPGARWWSASEAVAKVLGVSDTVLADHYPEVYDTLGEIVYANDVLTGEDRRASLVAYLRALATSLAEAR